MTSLATPPLTIILLQRQLKIIPAPSGSDLICVSCRFGCSPPHSAHPNAVFSGVRWSMAALPVTYDNMSGMRTRPLRCSSGGASSWDIERALFGDASSFLRAGTSIFPNSQRAASLLCGGPVTFFSQSSRTWLAHQAGQWVVAVYAGITQKPLSMSCN